MSATGMSSATTTPGPTQTPSSTQNPEVAGTAIVGFVVLMVVVAVVLAWLGGFRGRRIPEPRPADKPFRPT
jgi:hypothetical protein